GILTVGGVVIVHNSTLAGNIVSGSNIGANGSGGAISGSGVSITNSTLAENAACGVGGIASGEIVTMQNTILAHNHHEPTLCGTAPASPPGSDCEGVVTSLGHNLLGDPRGWTITLHPSDLTCDPGLATFTDSGKRGIGHSPLLPTSQAIDAGNDVGCPPRDQLGQRRVNIPNVGTSRCDIGAIEFPGKDDRPHDEVAAAVVQQQERD